MIRPLRSAALLALCVLAVGCGRSDRVTVEGQRFSARAVASGADRHDFAVTVRQRGAPLDTLRAAAAQAGINYCIRTYGSSDIAWTVAPEVAQPGGEDFVLTGRCLE